MRGWFRLPLVFLLVWGCSRSAIYFLPGDPAEYLVHESLVNIDTSTLRKKMDLDTPPLKRIFSLPSNQSLIKSESTQSLLRSALIHSTILTLYTLFFAIPLTLFLLFLHFNRGLSRLVSNGITLILASCPVFVLGPLLLRSFPLPNPLLPALTLALHLTAFWYRALSKKLEFQLKTSSVTGARALGFAEFRVFSKNLLAPSLGGFISYFGTQFGVLLNGSLIVEALFQWHGLGNLLADSVLSRDYPVIEVSLLVATLLTLTAQQAGYRLQKWWDPTLK